MTNLTTTTTTATAARTMAEQAGLTGPALELAVRAGARSRHEGRVRRTLEAALQLAGGFSPEVAEEVLGWGEGSVPSDGLLDARADALWMLLTDLNGVNGPEGAGMEQGSTGRFLDHGGPLGSGRWYASDGNAYRVATLEAIRALIRTSVPSTWGTGMTRLSIKDDGDGPVVLVDGDAAVQTHPFPAYELAMVRRVLLALVRGEDRFCLGPDGDWRQVTVLLEGELALWGRMLNELEAQAASDCE